MKERRSKIAILVDILKLIQRKGRAKPTHILYGANLSHTRLKNYLEMLEEQGFIEIELIKGHKFYKITSKGRDFIKEFKKIEEISEAFGLSI
ncbi:MAG: hypothetical protein J7K26_03255 [Candidatus Aenigmarchaeota archaeon]|nr:hypothetical protein [Candidatus Aenigmarchaeota archaeon]